MKTMRRGRLLEEGHCGDCEVAPGEFHERGCDVERCPFCGGQLISCDCVGRYYDEDGERVDPTNAQQEEYERALEARGRMVWTGEWPGVAECREFGWYSYLGAAGWVRCAKEHPEASEDLNRLVTECVWDPEARRWVKR